MSWVEFSVRTTLDFALVVAAVLALIYNKRLIRFENRMLEKLCEWIDQRYAEQDEKGGN